MSSRTLDGSRDIVTPIILAARLRQIGLRINAIDALGWTQTQLAFAHDWADEVATALEGEPVVVRGRPQALTEILK